MWNNSQRKSAANSTNSTDTSLIAAGTKIKGDVYFSGALHLDGCIEGRIDAEIDSDAVFTLSEHGQVSGEIHVPYAVINGTIKGSVYAIKRLELAAEACVEGDVYYCVLEMAAGAQVNGRMVHQEEGLRQLPQPGTHGASGDVLDDDIVTDGEP